MVAKECKKLWKSLGDVPVDDNDCIGEQWHIFDKGTMREEIWHWFEYTFNISVATDLMHTD